MGNLAIDILNPDPSSDLNPDFGFVQKRPKSRVSYRPRNSRPLERQLDSSPFVTDLLWQDRPSAIAKALRQWEHLYEDNYFQLFMPDFNRYFAGRFLGPLDITQTAYEKWTIRGIFEELVGAALYEYPTDWDTWGITIRPKNDWGDVVWAAATAIINQTDAPTYLGYQLEDPGALNDFMKFQYFGYGFRLFCSQYNNRGQCDVYFDDVRIVAGLDLGTVAFVPPSPVVVKPDAPIGLHTVKVICLGNHNVHSVANTIAIDSIQVMR